MTEYPALGNHGRRQTVNDQTAFCAPKGLEKEVLEEVIAGVDQVHTGYPALPAGWKVGEQVTLERLLIYTGD